MTQFLYPHFFWLLALPFFVRFFLPTINGLHGDALRVPFLDDIAKVREKSRGFGYFSASKVTFFSKGFVFLFLLWSLLITSAARPQWLGTPIRIENEGRNILMVMDISTSMNEADFVYNNQRIDRLTAVKLSADEFLKQRPSDRFGIILFGSRAYLQSPISFDKKAISNILWSMDAGMAGNSTAIGDALGLALKTLKENNSEEEKIVILLTDGENNDGSLTMPQAIQMAEKENVTIYTIGVGSEGGFISSFFGINLGGGQTQIDEESLSELANKTKGKYFRAKDTIGLQQVYEQIDKLKPSPNQDQFVQEVIDLFYVPLSLALVLALLVLLIKRKVI